MKNTYKIWVTKRIQNRVEHELQAKFLCVRKVHTNNLDDFCPVEISTHSEIIYKILWNELEKDSNLNKE